MIEEIVVASSNRNGDHGASSGELGVLQQASPEGEKALDDDD